MTLSLYSTYKAWRRDSAAEAASRAAPAAKPADPIQNSVCHALTLLGMGVEGVSCGGDITYPGRGRN